MESFVRHGGRPAPRDRLSDASSILALKTRVVVFRIEHRDCRAASAARPNDQRDGRGKRQTALEPFFIRPEEDVQRETRIAPDELLTAITVPKPASGSRSAYMKLGEKESFDWPIAEVAVVLRRGSAPRNRCGGAEDDGRLRSLNNNAYKLPIFETVIRRTTLAAAKA